MKITKTHLSRTTALAASTALALTLVGCSNEATSGDSGSSGTQSLTYGISDEPTDIKTGVDQGSAAKEVTALVRRGLLQYDAEGEPIPALAESYEVSDDELTYTFKLHPDLTFTNGDPLTSADVKRTFEYFADESNGATYQTEFSNITDIKTPDDSTVELELDKPQTALPEILADPLSAIVPEEPLDDDGIPIGAGPFEITEYKQGVSFTLEANKDFYNADEVNLKEIEMTFMPDAQTRVKALMSGQVEFIDYVPASDFESLESQQGVTLDYAPGLYGAIQFNMKNEPLDDPKVRQAIGYALDDKSLNDVGTLGYGTTSSGLPIPEDSDYYDEEKAQHFAYDPDKAKKLLKEAGHEDGINLELLTTSQYFGYTERAQVIKSNLEDVGISVNISTGDYANLVSQGDDGNYDLLISGPPAAMKDPTALKGAFLGGDSFVRSIGIDQDKYADLLDKGASTPDGPEREKIYDELGDIYIEDAPFITNGQGATGFAYTDSLEGFNILSGPLNYSSIYSFETAEMSK